MVTPADWARQGMVAGTPFALAHTFAQTGPFRPANTVRGCRQRGARRIVHGAGRRRAHRAAVRAAGRRPHHRASPQSGTIAAREGRAHDPVRTRRRGCFASRALRDAYRRCRRTQRPARPHVLPGHPAAGAGAAPGGARAVRLRPAAPTTSSTTSTTPLDSTGENRTAAAPFDRFFDGWPRRRRGDGPGARRGACTPPRATASPLGTVRRLPGVDADGPDRHRLSRPGGAEPLHARLGRGDRSAAAAGAGHGRPRRGGRTVRRGAGKGVPAHQLPARCRRGPGARQRVYLPADELAAYRRRP